MVVWPGPRGRRDSLSSQDSSEYGTPPASPTPSSLYTADEGGAMVWIEGQGPTQTDRQVSDNVISKLVFFTIYFIILKALLCHTGTNNVFLVLTGA